MQCHEIKQLLNNSKADFTDEVMKHIESCPGCAALVNAESIIRRGIIAEKHSQETKTTDLSLLKMKVGARQKASEKKELSFMSKLKSLYASHPKASLSLTTFAVLLLFFTLIPFPYTLTTGYTVEFSDQDKNSYAYIEPVKSALDAVGYGAATVSANTSGDETTISIFNLPTYNSAREAAAIYNKLSNQKLKPAIIPILKKSSGTLYAQVKSYFIEVRVDTGGKTDTEIAAEIEAKLTTLGLESNIDFSTDTDSNKIINIEIDSDNLDIPEGEEAVIQIEFEFDGE